VKDDPPLCAGGSGIVELRKEKRLLQTKLRIFEKQFQKNTGRKVATEIAKRRLEYLPS
jgi:hypothetical protein